MSVLRLADTRAQNERDRTDLLVHLHTRIQDQLLGRLPVGHPDELMILIDAPQHEDWLTATEIVVVHELFGYLPTRERHALVRHAWRWAWAQAKHDTPRGEAENDRDMAVLYVTADANGRLRSARGLTTREAWTEQLMPIPAADRVRNRPVRSSP